MATTECLTMIRQDHADIRTMLGVLDATVGRLACGEHTDPEMLAGISRFFEQFVAGSHERKEEHLLLPAVAPLCSVPERRDIRAFKKDYAHGRRLVRTLSRMLRRADSASDATPLKAAANEYIAHVQSRLETEERWFPGMLSRLSSEDDRKLHAACERLQRERIGPTGREWYTQVVADYRDIVATWSTFPPPIMAAPKYAD